MRLGLFSALWMSQAQIVVGSVSELFTWRQQREPPSFGRDRVYSLFVFATVFVQDAQLQNRQRVQRALVLAAKATQTPLLWLLSNDELVSSTRAHWCNDESGSIKCCACEVVGEVTRNNVVG